jgi:hypothetical protein
MRVLGFILVVIALSGGSSMAAQKKTMAGPAALPPDVVDFVGRTAGCRNVASVRDFDPLVQPQAVEAEMTRMRCTDLPADKTRLAQKYAGNPAILEALDP